MKRLWMKKKRYDKRVKTHLRVPHFAIRLESFYLSAVVA
jgi:hypothetical protein